MAAEDKRVIAFPRKLFSDDEALDDIFQQVAISKEPGDALAWWEHKAAMGSTEESFMVVANRQLLAGEVHGADLANANQAQGQSGAVVMMVDVELAAADHRKNVTLVVKTGNEYPAPDCDFYLNGSLYNRIPEVFLNVFMVQAAPGKGFTIVMEKFAGSFPGKPGMNAYSRDNMLAQQLPPVISTLAKFHAAFWNDASLAPAYLKGGDNSQHEKDHEDGFRACLQRRIRHLLSNPSALKVDGYEWLTDMSIANVMKGLGQDGMVLVGAQLRYGLLRKMFPSTNWESQVPLLQSGEGRVESYCSYKQLWDLAYELRTMHDLPLGIGGIIQPNQNTKAFFESPTKGHWTLVHNDAKFENVLLDAATGQAKVFDFDLVGLGSGPMDLACFFISMWEGAVGATEASLLEALTLERQQVIVPYFETVVSEIGSGCAAPSLIHIADRYYGSGSVSTVLIMNLLAAKEAKKFHDFLPRSISFLKRCIAYWRGAPGNSDAKTGRAIMMATTSQ